MWKALNGHGLQLGRVPKLGHGDVGVSGWNGTCSAGSALDGWCKLCSVDELTREVLGVLGDGGTVAQASRIVEWLRQRRLVDPGRLAGVAEVAQDMRRSRSWVTNWKERDPARMPIPVTILAMGPVWDLNDWQSLRPVRIT